MEYRKAILSDCERLAQLRVAMLNEDEDYSDQFNTVLFDNTKEFIEHGLTDGSSVLWVALDGNLTVTMCCVTFFTLPPNDWCPNGKTAYIGNLYTLPDFRKQGIASRLLQLVIDEAKNNECARILLHTTDMGKGLYEKHGFEQSPTAMAFYPFGITPGK